MPARAMVDESRAANPILVMTLMMESEPKEFLSEVLSRSPLFGAKRTRYAARHGNDIPATLLKQVSQHVAAGQPGSTVTSAVRFVGIYPPHYRPGVSRSWTD
jgi:hypothetical protein